MSGPAGTPRDAAAHGRRRTEPVRVTTRRVADACALAVKAAPRTLALYLTLTLAAGLLPVASAWLTKLLVDDLATHAPTPTVLASAAGLGITGLVAGVTPQITRYLRSELDRRVGVLAQDRLFAAVDRITGLARLEDPRFLDRLRLAQQAGRELPNQTVDALLGILRSALTLSGFLGSLTLLNPVMTALVLIAALPVLVAELALSRRRAGVLWEVGSAERREFFYSQLLTSSTAAKEIRLFRIGAFLRGRMLRERQEANSAKRAVDRREVQTQAGLGLLATAVSGGGLLWAVAAASSGKLTIGGVMVFVAAVAGVQSTCASMAAEVARVQQGLLLFEHYRAVTAAGSDLPCATTPVTPPALRHGIELKDVWFRYSPHGPWVLRGVTMVIPYGTAVALVGLNGSGKSTLVKLLCRFYDPVKGAILWDGVDLRDMDVADLRRRISAVFQDYMTYDMTAAENIGMGDIASLHLPDRIHGAAQRAGVHETLAALPDGYDTLLSRTFAMPSQTASAQDGVTLSGGQWQRLALARALLPERHEFVILDEPSAGLDAAAEHEIHSCLRQHRSGRTSLLISHRLSAVCDADLIVVLGDGRVVEQGDHRSLVASGGAYARLFALQADGYRPPQSATPADAPALGRP
ncbi:ABC transporter ATP-binding protein [Streptomyces sp. NPDC001852]|uniref:ABC transporter ATP-binding protein n=1 Tax=Streptomyces sp. NPDC001852 TaxID=3364619 RepID=UPI00367549E3